MHEARSKRKTAAEVNRKGLTQKRDCAQQNSETVGTIARVHEKHVRTRRTIAADDSAKEVGRPARHSEAGDEVEREISAKHEKEK